MDRIDGGNISVRFGTVPGPGIDDRDQTVVVIDLRGLLGADDGTGLGAKEIAFTSADEALAEVKRWRDLVQTRVKTLSADRAQVGEAVRCGNNRHWALAMVNGELSMVKAYQAAVAFALQRLKDEVERVGGRKE